MYKTIGIDYTMHMKGKKGKEILLELCVRSLNHLRQLKIFWSLYYM